MERQEQKKELNRRRLIVPNHEPPHVATAIRCCAQAVDAEAINACGMWYSSNHAGGYVAPGMPAEVSGNERHILHNSIHCFDVAAFSMSLG
jgi:molybdopterin-biosynthesis enzyme MoeA-like protein